MFLNKKMEVIYLHGKLKNVVRTGDIVQWWNTFLA
jgi:hypothetical protein